MPFAVAKKKKRYSGSALNMCSCYKKSFEKNSLITLKETKKIKFDYKCVVERPGHQVGLRDEPLI